MAQPLARVLVGVGIVGRLIHHADLHFVDAHSRARVVGDIKIACEGAQLLELDLINLDIFSKRHRELQFSILTTSKVLYCPLDASL